MTDVNAGGIIILRLRIVLQVFENLMSNAVRYAECEINVLLETKNDRLVITVSDDGCGFNAKDIKIATDPFYTTEKKSEGVHFGLGLNVCKILCQRHGGNIQLGNINGKSACITVSF